MHVMRLCKFVRIYPKAAHDAYFPAGLLTRLESCQRIGCDAVSARVPILEKYRIRKTREML